MANSPAKNINSLDSQTIVPTLTRLGRVSEWTLLDSKLVVVVATLALWPERCLARCAGWGVADRSGTGRPGPSIRSLP